SAVRNERTSRSGCGSEASARRGGRGRESLIGCSLVMVGARIPPYLSAAMTVLGIGAAALAQERVRTEIPYRDGPVVIVSDYQERITRSRYRAQGNVVVTHNDVTVTADEVEYDEETRAGATRGKTRFAQGKQWLT